MTMFEFMAGRSVSIASGLLAVLFLLTGIVFAQSAFPKTPGVWLSGEAGRKLSGARVEELTRSLRRITGFGDLRFAKDGSLALGAAQSGGAATARRILSCSLGSGSVFIIEDHSGSPSVNFGQLNEGMRYEDAMAGLCLEVWEG